MKFKELEKKFKHMRSEMPAGINHITGEYLPELPLCGNIIQLAGRGIALTSAPHIEQSTECAEARKALQNILFIELNALRDEYITEDMSIEDYEAARAQFHKASYEKFYEPLKQAYINVMTEEAKLGCVRIPVKYQLLDETARVQSQYGDWTVRYSPVLTEVLLTEPKAIAATAAMFAEAYLMEKVCAVITINFKRAMREIDYFKAQSVLGEFFHTINDYLIEEFEQKKDNEKYRYRNDWDPKLL